MWPPSQHHDSPSVKFDDRTEGDWRVVSLVLHLPTLLLVIFLFKATSLGHARKIKARDEVPKEGGDPDPGDEEGFLDQFRSAIAASCASPPYRMKENQCKKDKRRAQVSVPDGQQRRGRRHQRDIREVHLPGQHRGTNMFGNVGTTASASLHIKCSTNCPGRKQSWPRLARPTRTSSAEARGGLEGCIAHASSAVLAAHPHPLRYQSTTAHAKLFRDLPELKDVGPGQWRFR